MKILIDASNIKAGGGITHLVNLLENINYKDYKFSRLDVILNNSSKISLSNPNIGIIKSSLINGNFLKETFWKMFCLPKIAKKYDIVFCPGATYPGRNVKYISMPQNMLVFEKKEQNRFPLGITKIRYKILNILQKKSLKNSIGNIYLSNYAKDYIQNLVPELNKKKSKVIYHGILNDLFKKPSEQLPISIYNENKRFKILYVSIINYYKHQWNVVKAIKELHKRGYPIELELVGPAHPKALHLLNNELKGSEDFIFYKGSISSNKIKEKYHNSDLFIFASTCENMPNILIEAMASGLPLISSSYGPMPEILNKAGIYFDPLDVNDLVCKLEKLLLDPVLRKKNADSAFHIAQRFSWEKTSKQTFNFIKEVYLNSIN